MKREKELQQYLANKVAEKWIKNNPEQMDKMREAVDKVLLYGGSILVDPKTGNISVSTDVIDLRTNK